MGVYKVFLFLRINILPLLVFYILLIISHMIKYYSMLILYNCQIKLWLRIYIGLVEIYYELCGSLYNMMEYLNIILWVYLKYQQWKNYKFQPTIEHNNWKRYYMYKFIYLKAWQFYKLNRKKAVYGRCTKKYIILTYKKDITYIP